MAANVGSLYGITIPTQSAPRQKKNIRRQPNDANAFRMTLRGLSDSPAAMDMNSGPTILSIRINYQHVPWDTVDGSDKKGLANRSTYVNAPWIMQLNTPRKRPVSPGTRCETNAP